MKFEINWEFFSSKKPNIGTSIYYYEKDHDGLGKIKRIDIYSKSDISSIADTAIAWFNEQQLFSTLTFNPKYTEQLDKEWKLKVQKEKI